MSNPESFSSNTSPPNDFQPDAGELLDQGNQYVGVDENSKVEIGGKTIDSNIAPVQPIGGTGSMVSGNNTTPRVSDSGTAYLASEAIEPGVFNIMEVIAGFTEDSEVVFTPSGVLTSEMVNLIAGIGTDTTKTVSSPLVGVMPVGRNLEGVGIITERNINKSVSDSSYEGEAFSVEDWETSLAPAVSTKTFSPESVGYLSATSPTGVLANEILGMIDGGGMEKTTVDVLMGAVPIGDDNITLQNTPVQMSPKTVSSSLKPTPVAGFEFPIITSASLEDYIRISRLRDNMPRDNRLIKISDLIASWSEDRVPDWGDITGTLSDQLDLQSALDGKEDDGVAQGIMDTHETAFDHTLYTTLNDTIVYALAL